MPLKRSAFPKCYLDQIVGDRTMSVFDWIEQARALDAEGLEMYDGFFTSLDDAYLDGVGDALQSAGFAMPMLCNSPDFTNPDADGRKDAAPAYQVWLMQPDGSGAKKLSCAEICIVATSSPSGLSAANE